VTSILYDCPKLCGSGLSCDKSAILGLSYIMTLCCFATAGEGWVRRAVLFLGLLICLGASMWMPCRAFRSALTGASCYTVVAHLPRPRFEQGYSVLLLQVITSENHTSQTSSGPRRRLAQKPPELCSNFREMDSSVSDDNITHGIPSPFWVV
jgi:hypothetical protein